eukprot:gene10558-12211_t
MGNNMSELHEDAMEANYSQLCHHLQSLSGKIDQQEDKVGAKKPPSHRPGLLERGLLISQLTAVHSSELWLDALHIAATKGCEASVRELLRPPARSTPSAGQPQPTAFDGPKAASNSLSGKTPLDLIPSGAKHQPLRWLVSAAKSSTAAPAPPATNASNKPGAGQPAEIAAQMSDMALNSPHTQSSSSSATAAGPLHASPPAQRGPYPPGYGAPQAPSAAQQGPYPSGYGHPQAPSTAQQGPYPPGYGLPLAPSAAPSWTHQLPTPPSSMPMAPGAHQAPPPPPLQPGGVYDMSKPGALDYLRYGMAEQHIPGSQVPSHPTSVAFRPAAAGQLPPPGSQVPRPPSEASDGDWGDPSSPTSTQAPQHMHPAPAGQPMQPPPSQYTAAQAQQLAQQEAAHQQAKEEEKQEEEKASNPFMFWKRKKKDSPKASPDGYSADSQAAAAAATITQPPAAAAAVAAAPLSSDSDGGWGDDGETYWGGAPVT